MLLRRSSTAACDVVGQGFDLLQNFDSRKSREHIDRILMADLLAEQGDQIGDILPFLRIEAVDQVVIRHRR
jgi:hypothetical protein